MTNVSKVYLGLSRDSPLGVVGGTLGEGIAPRSGGSAGMVGIAGIVGESTGGFVDMATCRSWGATGATSSRGRSYAGAESKDS